MRWENIQRRLRHKLGELFYQEQSIRSIVRDVDSTLESFIIWNGNAVDCWSGILKEVRNRHLELELIEVVQTEHPQDKELQKAKDDIILNKTLTPGTTSTVSSTPASISPAGPVQSPPIDGIGPINVFISYAEDDEKFKQELEKHLKMLKRRNIIHSVHSQSIAPGQLRKQDVANLIDAAQIVLLLVSHNFLDSDQLYDNEMLHAMKRRESGASQVIPIILRSTDLTGTPFQELLPLPRNGRPIGTPTNDEAWSKIAEEIRKVCEDLRNS